MAKRFIILSILLLYPMSLSAQLFGIKLKGKVQELLSSEKNGLEGILTDPKICPTSIQHFSFTRQLGKNHYLYIYNISDQTVMEVTPATSQGGLSITPDPRSNQSPVYNDQLDWRPVNDKLGRQWFAFVNGSEDNHDIYLGYVGGNNYLRLTTDIEVDESPKWSPDGETLAFLSTRNGNSDIYFINNIDEVIANRPLTPAEQITFTGHEIIQFEWNPNPRSNLLAYARRSIDSQGNETFQLYVMDVKNRTNPPLPVSNATYLREPLHHCTRPLWNPYKDNQLLFVGQPVFKDSPANLYIVQLYWSKNNTLVSRLLSGKNTEVFKNVRLNGTPAVWLPGGDGILCQLENRQQQYPLFSVNVVRWAKREVQVTNFFEELHQNYPHISGYDVRDNPEDIKADALMIFSTQQGKYFKLFAGRLASDDVLPVVYLPRWVMNNPVGKGPGFPWNVMRSPWFLGAVAGAAAGYTCAVICGGDDPFKIPDPPSMPGSGQ